MWKKWKNKKEIKVTKKPHFWSQITTSKCIMHINLWCIEHFFISWCGILTQHLMLYSCYYVMKQRHQKPFHNNTLKITSGNKKKSQITENFKRVWHNNSVWFICVKCTIKILRYFQSSRCPILIYNSQQPTSINESAFIWRDLIFTLIALISKILFTRVSISIYVKTILLGMKIYISKICVNYSI